jgi:spermidine synthase
VSSVEIARAESERGELVLLQRAETDGTTTLELRANGVFVMDTGETTSERELARQALGRSDRPRRVLVGGLGLGFTLEEVLAEPRVERVTVVEIEPALVGWLRDGTVPRGPALMTDPRVKVLVGDVAQTIEQAGQAAYDLVLLDVDNGPGYLVHDANAALYDTALIQATRTALAEHGLCAIWSADHDERLAATLRGVFGNAEATAYDVDLQGRAEQYWLHLARRVPSEG